MQQKIREHQDFDRWFVEYPEVLSLKTLRIFDKEVMMLI